jgi:flagellar biosynthesis GTPase FlhF
LIENLRHVSVTVDLCAGAKLPLEISFVDACSIVESGRVRGRIITGFTNGIFTFCNYFNANFSASSFIIKANTKVKLAEAESALNAAKIAESTDEKAVSLKKSNLESAQKALSSAKKAAADAESKLDAATKKEAELKKKAEAKAKEDKKKADKKAKEDKKKAEKKAKEDKKKAEKIAKKQKEQAKKQAEKEKKRIAAEKKKNKGKDTKKTTPAKAKTTTTKASVKSTSSAVKKVVIPNEQPVTGIKLNEEELKKLRALDDRYAGKKEAPPAAPEAPVNGKKASAPKK